MSLFWNYFRNKLRLGFICLPGPLAMVVEGAALCFDDVRIIILWLRDQFLPEKCDEEFLVNFARSRGIVQAPLETTAHYQGRVRFAYLWWTRGGRAGAMRLTLMEFFDFADVTIVSMRNEDPARWAEFRVEIDVLGGNLDVNQAQLEWAVDEIKPARSKRAEMLFTFAVAGGVPVHAIGLQSSEIVTVYPQ